VYRDVSVASIGEYFIEERFTADPVDP